MKASENFLPPLTKIVLEKNVIDQGNKNQINEAGKSQLIIKLLMIFGFILGLFFAATTIYTAFYYTPPANCPHVRSQCNPPHITHFHTPPLTRCYPCGTR